MADPFWKTVEDLIDRKIRERAGFIAYAGSQSAGKAKILRVGEATAGDELYAMLHGMPKLATNDEVVVLVIGGKPHIVGKNRRATQTDITYDLPVVGEQGFNSPVGGVHMQNSATTGTNTSNSSYVTAITTDIVLPTGTWTVITYGTSGYYHATGGSTVDHRMVIDGSSQTLRNMRVGLQADGHTTWECGGSKVGVSGTITLKIEYKNNAGSGQINAGGGGLVWLAFRTS